MKQQKISVPTVILIAALTGAVGFAIGRATVPPPEVVRSEPAPIIAPTETMEQLPPGHPALGSSSEPHESALAWTAPARWKEAPNTSSMRLATYKIPRAPGDAEDPELSVTQAGGTPDANADRWIGQFDAAAQKSATRSIRTTPSFKIAIVEITGTYSGGMDQAGAKTNWTLLGAIVPTPGMSHFFKMTGPAKSVAAARTEFLAMLDTAKTSAP